MIASFLDFRKHARDIIKALDRREDVTILYRGKVKAVMSPVEQAQETQSAKTNEAFGMWADRKDMADVAKNVRTLRKGRYGDL